MGLARRAKTLLLLQFRARRRVESGGPLTPMTDRPRVPPGVQGVPKRAGGDSIPVGLSLGSTPPAPNMEAGGSSLQAGGAEVIAITPWLLESLHVSCVHSLQPCLSLLCFTSLAPIRIYRFRSQADRVVALSLVQ